MRLEPSDGRERIGAVHVAREKRVKVGKGNDSPDSLHLSWAGSVEERMDENYERSIMDECRGLMALGRLVCSLSLRLTAVKLACEVCRCNRDIQADTRLY